MISTLALSIALSKTPAISLDKYGVPKIVATGMSEAFRLLGSQTASDRLWQLELSRRLFQGQMAEVFGGRYAASDRETLRLMPSEDEMTAQFNRLPKTTREIFESYASGINQNIEARKKAGQLPPQYAEIGLEPRPWTVNDSCAIAIGMGRRFGAGGAGEIRNLLGLRYLKSTKAGPRVLDALDDILFQNIPSSIPTLDERENLGNKPANLFPAISREISERHVAMLPAGTPIELLPGMRLMKQESQASAAMGLGLPYKWGSYAIAVPAANSQSGRALLLSAPQMGHSNPSVVYEVCIDTPGAQVSGITVPGVPSIVIGHTPKLAWGLTTGVADTQDIYFAKKRSNLDLDIEGLSGAVTEVKRTLKIKGLPDETVVRRTCALGTIVLEPAGSDVAYIQKSTFHGRELEGFSQMMKLYQAGSAADVFDLAQDIPLGFNLFFATQSGDAGYAYCGILPVRSSQYDPRFPLPARKDAYWKGTVPIARMVRGLNPKKGFFANWNNKPVAWWPNLDTPAWGELFRNQLLIETIPSGRIGVKDLVYSASEIGLGDDAGVGVLRELLLMLLDTKKLTGLSAQRAKEMRDWNGLMLDSTTSPKLYLDWIAEVRNGLFADSIGNFFSPDLFATAIQPSVILRALKGATHFDFVGSKDRSDIVTSAFTRAVARGGTFTAGRMNYGAAGSVAYSNRGTYVQIVEMGPKPFGRSILAPGNAESGPHNIDQIPLAAAWRFKPKQSW